LIVTQSIDLGDENRIKPLTIIEIEETQKLVKLEVEKLEKKPYYACWLKIIGLSPGQARDFLNQAPFKGGTCAGQSWYLLHKINHNLSEAPQDLIRSMEISSVFHYQLLTMIYHTLCEPLGIPMHQRNWERLMLVNPLVREAFTFKDVVKEEISQDCLKKDVWICHL
jgi:hypothetical protein